MRVLVTGGAGFIGSHLVERLVRDHHQVTVLDDFSTGSRANLASVEGKVRLVEGTVVSPEDCRTALAGGVEAVLHHAAIPSVVDSVKDPVGTHGANLTGTLNLLWAAREAGVRRFVFAGSTAVYGEEPEVPTSEDALPRPMSPYAVQKLGSEGYCLAFRGLYGLLTFSLRYFNIFGPRQDPNSPYGAVVPKLVTAMLRGEAPVVHGDGEQSRDFCYVENVVEANLLALAAPPEAAGRAYNIGCGESYSVNQLFQALREILAAQMDREGDRAAAARYRAMIPETGEARPGDVRRSFADIGRVRKELGYRVTVSFQEGLERTVGWYRGGH